MGPLHVLIEPDGLSLGSPGIFWVLQVSAWLSPCSLASSLIAKTCEGNLEL